MNQWGRVELICHLCQSLYGSSLEPGKKGGIRKDLSIFNVTSSPDWLPKTKVTYRYVFDVMISLVWTTRSSSQGDQGCIYHAKSGVPFLGWFCRIQIIIIKGWWSMTAGWTKNPVQPLKKGGRQMPPIWSLCIRGWSRVSGKDLDFSAVQCNSWFLYKDRKKGWLQRQRVA